MMSSTQHRQRYSFVDTKGEILIIIKSNDNKIDELRYEKSKNYINLWQTSFQIP